MNELRIFEKSEFGQVRTLEENGAVLFCGMDVAKALGYAVPRKALFDHCKGVLKRNTLTNGGEQEMSFIPESDLYRLAFRSKLPTAEKFTDWVTMEVLPTIRKTGGYVNNEELFLDTYLPGVDENVRSLFKLTLGQLRSANEKIKELDLDLNLLALHSSFQDKKVAYFDACVERNMLTTLRETAKLCGVGEKRFVRYLLDNRYLYRGRSGKLLPYATRPAEEMFTVREFFDPENRHGGVQTYVTPRGRETFRLLLNGQPESGLWGRPSKELPRKMTEEDKVRMEDYYQKEAKKAKHA